MSKLNFNDFIKKVRFILGDKISLNDLSFNKIDLYHLNEFEYLNDESFVEEMYKILLRRVFDEGGKIGKLNELSSGKSRKDMILDMINSEEGQNYIGIYEFLGINYKFDYLDESILYKYEYSEEDFSKLISFLNFRFKKLPDNIIDILSFSGSEFVFLLYKILLKRDPDLIGFNYHLKASYLLDDKLEKMRDFLSSDEAKSKNIKFYDLKGQDISGINVENISLFYANKDKKINTDIKELVFNFLLDKSLFNSIVFLSSFCDDFTNCFEIISRKILLQNKTIIETIYEEEILGKIKNVIIIDFFGKIVQIGEFSYLDDLVRNNSYYLSYKNNRLKGIINTYNLEKNLIYNLESELIKIVKFLKRNVALKKDLENLYKNEKFLVENLNNILEMVKEHEEFVLSASKDNISHRNRRNKKRRK